ncbi:hypothetical protein Rhe02_36780 [Rhizocola hellebori]|uniref:PH domain-containing protein n=1 Tax=Rhizocola hellebori TaxID=1392758 RepID=A0A8J3Q836_9ACTN|nr:hypothetical protein Rhe02_36780 [Rhizocola hellebori]
MYQRDQDKWYPLIYLVTAVMSVGGLFPLWGFAMGEVDPVFAPVIVLFVLIWEILIWRIVLVGVYVGDAGVKIRMVLRSHVVPWPRLARAWAGQAAHYDAWQIWISTRDPERDLQTPIWRKGSRARHKNRILLSPHEFGAVLDELNRPRTPK